MGSTKKSAAKTAVPDEIADPIEQIQTEAKAGFSLRDRLAGYSSRSEKVLLVTDTAAGKARQEKLAVRDNAKAEIEFWETQEANEATTPLLEAAREKLATAETELEAANVEMLKSALSIHMRGLPNVALKFHRQKAKKKFAPKGGKVPEESLEAYEDHLTRRMLEEQITEIRDADGNEGQIDVDALYELLPFPEWQKIVTTMNRLNFEDMVGQAATDDPGF